MKTIQEQFEEFHSENPQVYSELVKLATQAHERGRSKIGIKMLFEVLRWNRMITTRGEIFKLNNIYTSHYSRLIMQEFPYLEGIFNLRELTAK